MKWYRDPAVKIVLFLLVNPLWALIVFLDQQEPLYMRAIAVVMLMLSPLFALLLVLEGMSNLGLL